MCCCQKPLDSKNVVCGNVVTYHIMLLLNCLNFCKVTQNWIQLMSSRYECTERIQGTQIWLQWCKEGAFHCLGRRRLEGQLEGTRDSSASKEGFIMWEWYSGQRETQKKCDLSWCLWNPASSFSHHSLLCFVKIKKHLGSGVQWALKKC